MEALLGQPGAGKSYSAVVIALREFVRGRTVITNLPINEEAFRAEARMRRWRGVRRSKEYAAVREAAGARRRKRKRSLNAAKRRLMRGWAGRPPPGFRGTDAGQKLVVWPQEAFTSKVYWQEALETARARAPKGAVILVDEFPGCLRDVNAVEWSDVSAMLERHRHFYAEIIVIAQNHSQLDGHREIKKLVQRWHEVRNLRRLTGVSAYTRSVYVSWRTDRVREPIATFRGRFRKAVFDLYRSHALGAEKKAKAEGAGEVGEEQYVRSGGSLWVTGAVKFGFWIAVLGAVGYGIFALPDILPNILGFGGKVGDEEAARVAQEERNASYEGVWVRRVIWRDEERMLLEGMVAPVERYDGRRCRLVAQGEWRARREWLLCQVGSLK